ncbi:hypothetical protein ACHAPT_006666 [Fusarium lateritium]
MPILRSGRDYDNYWDYGVGSTSDAPPGDSPPAAPKTPQGPTQEYFWPILRNAALGKAEPGDHPVKGACPICYDHISIAGLSTPEEGGKQGFIAPCGHTSERKCPVCRLPIECETCGRSCIKEPIPDASCDVEDVSCVPNSMTETNIGYKPSCVECSGLFGDIMEDNPPVNSSHRSAEQKQQPFPSKIWQSWKDDSEDPTDRTVGFPHQWRTVNPDWRYERIIDSNSVSYVRDNFDESISEVFARLQDPILKADFLRYLILLREGGIWADIDVLPLQPVSRWIPEEYQGKVNLVIGIENDHHKEPIWPGSPYSVQLCQYTVLAKPNHPAIRNLVKQVTHGLDELLASKNPGEHTTFEEVMSTTGPFAFTKAMMDYFNEITGEEHTGNELDRLKEPRLIGDVLVLPKDSFGWLSHDNTHEEGDPSILVQHLFIGSWRGSHPG